MPYLIIARHGNTFEADQTPTFVGGRTDMKLTAAGEAQGEALATMIAAAHLPLSAITAGPLLRTKRFAEILSQKTNMVFTLDERLCEIDYGLWENKSTQEVIDLYGPEIVEAWEKNGVWPQDMNWAPSEDKLIRNVTHILDEQHKSLLHPKAHNRVIFTSNGILRFVYRAITGQNPDKAAKVKTGHYSLLTPTDKGWEIVKWNEKP